LISALPAEEIEELLYLGMINDRAWTIVACSAKEKEGKLTLFLSFNVTPVIIGLQDGLNWLIDNLES